MGNQNRLWVADLFNIQQAGIMLFVCIFSVEGTSVTRHIRRTGRIRSAIDAQLPEEVRAPALDPAPAHNRARVERSQGDGDGGDIWQRG